MSKKSGKFIGLAGLGYWGKNILRNLHEMGVLACACDSSKETLDEWSKKMPDVRFTRSFDEMLNDASVKAIAIATPAVTHYELAKKAMLAGKDVYVEKPLAVNVKEGEELVALAKQSGRVLMVGHILQYHPAVRKLKQILAEGRLGKLQYVYSNRLNIGKLRTEENILWSFAPHDISVITMLVGEGPVKVGASGGAYISGAVYDTTVTTLEFKNGVKGHIFVSWLHPFKEQKLVVVCSEAMVVFDDMTKEKLFIYPHKIEWKEGKIPVAQKAECEAVPIETGEPLRLELEHFVECCEERKTPLTGGEEGLRVLKVLDAAERAMPGAAAATEKDYFAHTSACVDDGVTIGAGTKIWHFSHVLKGSKIGKNCVVGQNVVIGPDVTMGEMCKVQNNVSLYKGVTLEDEVFCGPSCVFTNVINPRSFIERKSEFKDTLVRRGATIGANATIVCGNTLGKYSLVGAGAVVTKDVPDYAIVTGVPARVSGYVCECAVKLEFKKDKATCPACGKEYEKKKNTVTRRK